MKNKWPKIDLKTREELWLRRMYDAMCQGEEFDERIALVELWGELPHEFEPSEIDNRLVYGNLLSLLGVSVVDPKSDLLENADPG